MKLYRFNPDSGAYLGWVDADDPDAYAGLPGYTESAPPAAPEGSGQAWDGQAWAVAPDNRGMWHDPATRERLHIGEFGAIPPAGWVRGEPPPYVPTLEDLKAAKWVEIKSARDAMEFGGFTWNNSTFDSDSMSQSRIQGAAQLATLAMLNSQAFSIAWTLADNTVRTMSGADMIAAGQAMGVHIATAHEIGRTLRDLIEAAASAEDLELVTWPI